MLNRVWNAQQVDKRLRELAEADPQFNRFGADRHRYRLGPTLSVGDLARFEREHEITLPNAYGTFTTTVGNGGAGPYYGMYRHDGADWNNPHRELEQQQPGFLAMPFPHSEPFLPEPGNGEDFYAPSWLAGTLVLAEFGCGAYFRLVVTGPARGQVWFDDLASDQGLTPGPDFHDWYQTWLDNPKP